MILNCEIGERLFQLQNALRKKQRDFALELGFKTGNGLSMIQKGKNPLQEHHCRILELAHNVSIEWLKTGKGQMFKHANPELASLNVEPSPSVLLAKMEAIEIKISQLILMQERSENRVDMLIDKIASEGKQNENLTAIIKLLNEGGMVKKENEK